MKVSFKGLQNLASGPLGRLFNGIRLFGGVALFRPLYVMLALTYRCNLNCSYCFQSHSEPSDLHDMTIDEAKMLESNIRLSFGPRPRIHFIGGEPTVNAQLRSIAELFNDRGYKLSMTTNGMLLNEVLPDPEELKGLTRVVLSVNLANVPRLASLLSEFRRGLSLGRHLEVGVHCPLDLVFDGVTTTQGVIRAASAGGASYVSFLHPVRPFDRTITQEQLDNLRDQPRVYDKLRVVFFPDVPTKMLEDYYHSEAFPGPAAKCLFPWLVTFVQPDGMVIPCPEMGDRRQIMGNLLHEPLRVIWNSGAYREFRRSLVQQGPHLAACRRCCFRQYRQAR